MPAPLSSWTDALLLELFDTVADRCGSAVVAMSDRREKGLRPGQYGLDLRADEAALDLLDRAGLGVLSEESGLRRADAEIVVIIDPVDGSTNASRMIPWYATSLCAVDADGPRVSLVRNLATGTTFTARRGSGAERDGTPIRPAGATELSQSIVGLSGRTPTHLGWRQYRALGAAALDLCMVASGGLDAYLDCGVNSHGVWDYAGGYLVCVEAGASIVDAHNRDLIVLDPAARRTPVAACTESLLAEVHAARNTFE